MCSPNTYACKGVFNSNIPIFPPNSAEGLHFSAFHFSKLLNLRFLTQYIHHFLYSKQECIIIIIINPRCACAERVTVVVSCACVCVSVCLSTHAILAVRAIRSITKDAIVLSIRFAAILKWRFSLNCLIRKLECFLLTSAGAAIFS